MKISGTSTLTADRAAVYRALNDPQVLVATIPGCQRLEALGADAYKMTVAAGVGSIKGVYDGEVRLSDQQEPASFRMKAQGAGAPGTIGADVTVALFERRPADYYDPPAAVCEAMMKSEKPSGVICGCPWPRPRPTRPPQPMP